MKNIKSVPMPIYENEIGHKNGIIKALIMLIFTLIIVLGVSIYLFLKFIGSYDYTSYTQDGSGVNNLNTAIQGEVVNESKINH